jgi:hypothetical protein
MKGIKKMLAVAVLGIPMMFTVAAYARTAPAGGEEKGTVAAAAPVKKVEAKKGHMRHARKHVNKHANKVASAAKETKAPAGKESTPAGK